MILKWNSYVFSQIVERDTVDLGQSNILLKIFN